MRNLACGDGWFKFKSMTIGAVRLHCNGLESHAGFIRRVAVTALHNTATIGAFNTFFGQMYVMRKFQARVFNQLRLVVLIDAFDISKTGAGFYQYQLPLGYDGLLGIVGTFGLWIALFIAITTLLPVARLTTKSA